MRATKGSHQSLATRVAMSGPINVAIAKDAIDVQIEMLQREYDMTQEEIRQFNLKSANCRNWTVTLWAGSIAFAAAPTQGNAKSFIISSIIFPAMFWLQDIKWTQLQRIFILRGKLIMDYFASDQFSIDYNSGKVSGINIGGLRKRIDRELFQDPEYISFSSFWRVMFFPTKLSFYPILMAASLAIHSLFNKDEVWEIFSWVATNIFPPT